MTRSGLPALKASNSVFRQVWAFAVFNILRIDALRPQVFAVAKY